MVNTLVELFEEQVQRSSVRVAMRFYEDQAWTARTWRDWWERSERIAAGLMALGIEAGDHVALIASTRPAWVEADMGIAMAGAATVALHPAAGEAGIAAALSHCKPGVVIVEDPVQMARLVAIPEALASVRAVIYVDADVMVKTRGGRARELMRVDAFQLPEHIARLSIDELGQQGRRKLAEDSRYVASRRRQITPEMNAAVVFTAGTSAEPRAISLTHHNLVAQVEAMSALRLFSFDDVQLLFLPLAHVFARVLYLAGMGSGMTVAFGRGARHLLDDLEEVRPTLLASVPWVYERLQAEIVSRVEERGLRAQLMPLALEVGKTVRRRMLGGQPASRLLRWEHAFFSKVLLEDVRERLGGRMRFLISGGAPLRPEITEFFFSTGVQLLEGYGLTEACGAVAFNLPEDVRIGSVGRALPGVDVTLAEDGEVLVRGDTVAHGLTQGEGAGQVDARGWLHTGDIGRFDREGFLFIVDRKREVVMTSTGRQIAPGPLESALEEFELIAHAVLVGEGLPFVSALVALNPDRLLEFVQAQGLDYRASVRELTTHPTVHQALMGHLDEVNRRHAVAERIRRIAVIPEFLSVADQTLTASGEVRRPVVLERYQALVDSLYADRRVGAEAAAGKN
ncbi:AMP-binding protein [Lujinxingia vulgaris]|uniref:AMP-binding protein n=1 Tax=Lujinxingia vulgaris TaxID=2600176 RepID=A0A5C6XCZ9_9DELT|nr:AMP-binding protein [Lujinxingia vulgaris]TXD37641.1 AMP-binding protein [Lujinxingia vulgaris]